MSCNCKSNISESRTKMSCDCKKRISPSHTKWSNSTVIEDSGNSKNCINFSSLSKSRTEAIVKAAADQDQDLDIDF